MESLKEVKNAGGELAKELEESSLEAVVTSWLKRVSRDSIICEIESETQRYGYGMPLNSNEYVGRRLWGGISDEHYRDVFLWMVRSFVNGNKDLIKLMLKGEYKTRWD